MRVLIVEDDSSTAKSIELMLKSENFIVDHTDLGEDGLEIGKLYDYDIIVLDLQLPNVSGPMVAAKLNMLRSPRPRVLICSAVPYAPEIATDVGADGVLLKPFVRADLRHEVERLLAF